MKNNREVAAALRAAASVIDALPERDAPIDSAELAPEEERWRKLASELEETARYAWWAVAGLEEAREAVERNRGHHGHL